MREEGGTNRWERRRMEWTKGWNGLRDGQLGRAEGMGQAEKSREGDTNVNTRLCTNCVPLSERCFHFLRCGIAGA